ncbi:uncharacterized protein LOC122791286 isoform X2 [Protopterus annectens]|uniref:uncharacterized protein LOC122791286 isoform X2 n=1 Tax=Protopterus annectens TaxID=7888 RepID=UPI001CFB5242|nr:uncharacterized protein LOC122791286 isoform X2 [Protopterus annectens]
MAENGESQQSQLLFSPPSSSDGSGVASREVDPFGNLTALIQQLTQRVDNLAKQVNNSCSGNAPVVKPRPGVTFNPVPNGLATERGESNVSVPRSSHQSTSSIPPAQQMRQVSSMNSNGTLTQTPSMTVADNNPNLVLASNFVPPILQDFMNTPTNIFNNQNDEIQCGQAKEQENKNDIVSALKLFDNSLSKYKKLQLEILYFKECISLKIVPKGLRQWKYPSGVKTNSEFHKTLIAFFNQQGLCFLDILVKEYTEQMLTLEQQLQTLEHEIKTNLDFNRYQYDYGRIFSSIDSLLIKIGETKKRKINRDMTAYANGNAYPDPPSNRTNNASYFPSTDGVDITNENTPANAATNAGVINNNEVTYGEVPDGNQNRRSERIYNLNQQKQQADNGRVDYTNQGFQPVAHNNRRKNAQKKNQNNNRRAFNRRKR